MCARSRVDELRGEIDAIDEEIIDLLVRRLKVVRAIGEIKKEEGSPVADTRREAQILARAEAKAGPAFAGEIRRLFTSMFTVSKSNEADIISGATDEGKR